MFWKSIWSSNTWLQLTNPRPISSNSYTPDACDLLCKPNSGELADISATRTQQETHIYFHEAWHRTGLFYLSLFPDHMTPPIPFWAAVSWQLVREVNSLWSIHRILACNKQSPSHPMYWSRDLGTLTIGSHSHIPPHTHTVFLWKQSPISDSLKRQQKYLKEIIVYYSASYLI